MPERTLRDLDLLAPRGRSQDLLLLVGRRVIHLDVEHEAVQLRFRQRIGPLLLDGVLRGNGEEGLRQRIGGLSHGHFPLLHGLQQGGLGLGWGAVDLVGQEDAGEDRPLDEAEIPPPLRVLFQDVGAGDVRRHQVGGKLDALELNVQNLRQGADHQGLGQPRHAHQQAVPAGENGGEDLFDHVVLSDDDLLEFLLHQPAMLAEFLENVAQTARLSGRQREIPQKIRPSLFTGSWSLTSLL